jgi:hypothetical protein
VLVVVCEWDVGDIRSVGMGVLFIRHGDDGDGDEEEDAMEGSQVNCN